MGLEFFFARVSSELSRLLVSNGEQIEVVIWQMYIIQVPNWLKWKFKGYKSHNPKVQGVHKHFFQKF